LNFVLDFFVKGCRYFHSEISVNKSIHIQAWKKKTMPTGLLELTGSIDLNQFWPKGTSDADTTKVIIDVAEDAFRFRQFPNQPFRVTHVFDRAEVVGKVRKAPIDDKGRVTVRLQGVDAPELHFRPSAIVKKSEQTREQRKLFLKWNLEFRQRYGETATIVLHDLLAQGSLNPLPCKAVSAVDSPNDVFDTYGRLVGDIVVETNGGMLNVNRWLLENGWAVPTFYTSMTNEEITTLTQLAQLGKSKQRGFWPDYSRTIAEFEWELEFRGKGEEPNPDEDRGRFILPKLFRRQAAYHVNRRSKMFSGPFVKYLRQQPDDFHLASEFLQQGAPAAPVRFLQEFVVNSRLKADPWDLVFRERPSRLRRTDGGKVTWW
jgi:endonuclease YncB( thermonuclease family)